MTRDDDYYGDLISRLTTLLSSLVGEDRKDKCSGMEIKLKMKVKMEEGKK